MVKAIRRLAGVRKMQRILRGFPTGLGRVFSGDVTVTSEVFVDGRSVAHVVSDAARREGL
jgi:hypothetical protein